LPVIMFSTLTERGAAATLDALAAGANDYLTKPANVGSVSLAVSRIKAELIPKIKALCQGGAPAAKTPPPPPAAARSVPAVAAGRVIGITPPPPEPPRRPAGDVRFRPVGAAYGRRTLGIILTGMGSDGLRGCELIHEAGGRVVVQDEASSVVWGMPGFVARAGL